MTPWELHGVEMANCNCATGCPCQFMALPTHGTCEAVVALAFSRGHYGDVDLAGVRAAMVLKWPGPIHMGDGTMQIIVDDSASDAQRAAMQKILTGADTEDMATYWWVFSAMSPHKLETLYKPIEFDMNIEARTGSAKVRDVFVSDCEPLTNPVSGAAHRARIDLPHGFEFRLGEVAKGTTTTYGQIALDGNRDSHAHLCELHLNNSGVLDAA